MEVQSDRMTVTAPKVSLRPAISPSRLASPQRAFGSPMQTKISVRDLDFYYGHRQALFHVGLTIRSHSVTAFIGPSGCGKSTLLRCLNRMNDLVGGQVDAMFDQSNTALPQVQGGRLNAIALTSLGGVTQAEADRAVRNFGRLSLSLFGAGKAVASAWKVDRASEESTTLRRGSMTRSNNETRERFSLRDRDRIRTPSFPKSSI